MLILDTISSELAKATGVNTSMINLIYLLLVGLVVALGVKFIGTLLMGALVIIPAASAKNISGGIHHYHFLSVFFGIISTIMGILIASNFHLSSGPIVVLSSIFLFFISLIYKKLFRIL